MSEPSAWVYVDLRGVVHLVGRLWTTSTKGRDVATFEYDDSWLDHRERFALEPAFALGPGPFHTAPGRRIVFNVLISNTDDHLRNHGLLYHGPAGWRLSHAYDLNPVPTDIKPRVLSTAIGIDDDLTASLDLALEVAPEFTLKPPEARRIVAAVAGAVTAWRAEAEAIGVTEGEIDRMASAFEHDDLALALATRSS